QRLIARQRRNPAATRRAGLLSEGVGHVLSPSHRARQCWVSAIDLVLLVHRRDIVEPIEVGQCLQVGLVLDQLLGPAVEEADMRIHALDDLAVVLQCRSSNTPRKSCQTKCPSMNPSCKAVPQRTGEPRCGSRQNHAISARRSSCCARLMRGCGGISNERNSTKPSRPVGASGENSLSIQSSARWVLPVTSTRRLRNSRSTSQGRGGEPSPGAGTMASAISSS